MKKIFFFTFFLCILTILTGCPKNAFFKFYTPWYDENSFPADALLQNHEEPQIIKVSDLDVKFREILSNWYWCIGSSRFNGVEFEEYKITNGLKDLCKSKRAKLAIWSKIYTKSQSISYTVPHTNVHSYTDIHGNTHSYITTTHSTYSTSRDKFDYWAYLFIPIPNRNKFVYTPGFSVIELTQRDKEFNKQNTGCKVNIVFKNTPAYYANISYGDIITKINGKRIHSVNDYLNFHKKAHSGDYWKITLVRNGKIKEIKIPFEIQKQL